MEAINISVPKGDWDFFIFALGTATGLFKKIDPPAQRRLLKLTLEIIEKKQNIELVEVGQEPHAK